MASTTEITLEQLASVDAKLLFKALEMRLATAGVLKKRGAGKKAAAAKASEGDDAASEASAGRSVGEGTKAWNNQTSRVAALLKEAAIKGGAGFHLKVLSRLKETGLAADAEPSSEEVQEAAAWLQHHPEWVSPNQKAKAKKAEESGEEEKPAPSAKKAEAEAKKAAKAAEKAAKEEEKARKKAEAEAKKAEKEAKKGEKKGEKKAAKKAEAPKSGGGAAAAAKAKEEPEEDEEDESLVEVEFEGVSYFWDTASGAVFENVDGHPGERYGDWTGEGEIVRSS
jgi:hypothetical protein